CVWPAATSSCIVKMHSPSAATLRTLRVTALALQGELRGPLRVFGASFNDVEACGRRIRCRPGRERAVRHLHRICHPPVVVDVGPDSERPTIRMHVTTSSCCCRGHFLSEMHPRLPK